MRWFISLPLLLVAVPACVDETPDILDRDPIFRPGPLDPIPQPLPLLTPLELIELDLPDLDRPVLILDPDELGGHPRAITLVIDDGTLDPIDLVDRYPEGVLLVPADGLAPIDPDEWEGL